MSLKSIPDLDNWVYIEKPEIGDFLDGREVEINEIWWLIQNVGYTPSAPVWAALLPNGAALWPRTLHALGCPVRYRPDPKSEPKEADVLFEWEWKGPGWIRDHRFRLMSDGRYVSNGGAPDIEVWLPVEIGGNNCTKAIRQLLAERDAIAQEAQSALDQSAVILGERDQLSNDLEAANSVVREGHGLLLRCGEEIQGLRAKVAELRTERDQRGWVDDRDQLIAKLAELEKAQATAKRDAYKLGFADGQEILQEANARDLKPGDRVKLHSGVWVGVIVGPSVTYPGSWDVEWPTLGGLGVLAYHSDKLQKVPDGE